MLDVLEGLDRLAIERLGALDAVRPAERRERLLEPVVAEAALRGDRPADAFGPTARPRPELRGAPPSTGRRPPATRHSAASGSRGRAGPAPRARRPGRARARPRCALGDRGPRLGVPHPPGPDRERRLRMIVEPAPAARRPVARSRRGARRAGRAARRTWRRAPSSPKPRAGTPAHRPPRTRPRRPGPGPAPPSRRATFPTVAADLAVLRSRTRAAGSDRASPGRSPDRASAREVVVAATRVPSCRRDRRQPRRSARCACATRLEALADERAGSGRTSMRSPAPGRGCRASYERRVARGDRCPRPGRPSGGPRWRLHPTTRGATGRSSWSA